MDQVKRLGSLKENASKAKMAQREGWKNESSI